MTVDELKAKWMRGEIKLNDIPEYMIWKKMKSRCIAASGKDFYCYSSRNIRVCEEWRDDFWQFLTDVGLRQWPYLTIGRIDNDGDYEPRNVRWETHAEQARNRRTEQSPHGGYRRVPLIVVDYAPPFAMSERCE